MPKITKGDAPISLSGDQPYVLVSDGPDNSGSFNITVHDPKTGAPLSTLAHLADSFDSAKVPYFLPFPPAGLKGKILVCTGVLKRVGVGAGAGPLRFRLQVIQNKQPVYDGAISYPKMDLETFAYRIVFT